MQAGGVFPQGIRAALAIRREGIDGDTATAAFERRLDGFHHPHFFRTLHPKTVGHHVQHLAWPGGRGHLALRMHFGVTAGRQPLLDFFGRSRSGQLHGEGDDHTRVVRLGALQQVGVNRLWRIVAHALCGLAVKQISGAGEEQLQVVVQLRHRAHGGARGAHRVGLVDGNGGRHTIHPVHRWFVHAVEKLAGVGAEGFHITPLAFGIERVKHQTRFARATGARHHRHLPGADVQVDVLQIVLTGTTDADQAGGHGKGVLEESGTF